MKIIVTTPTGNIGKVVTKELLDAGAEVVLPCRSSEKVREFTDRGVNFSYLDPALRGHLDTLLGWISDAPTQEGDPENMTL